jgi:hypothetical protein
VNTKRRREEGLVKGCYDEPTNLRIFFSSCPLSRSGLAVAVEIENATWRATQRES